MENDKKEDRFKAEFRKALKAGQRRDYPKAIQILETLAMEGFADGAVGAQARGESHPEIHLYLARSWHALGSYARAALAARTYVKVCPDDAAGWFFLGRAWLADSNPERGFWALRRSLELNPASVDAHLVLGTALLRAKKPTPARETFESALSLAPDDERLNQAYRNALFVEAVQKYRRGETDMARQMLTFLIDNGLDGVAPRLYLAHALRELGYLAESLGQYEAAISFSPDDETLKWYRIAVSLEMGDSESAAAFMKEVGASFPGAGASPESVSLAIIKNHVDREEWVKAITASKMHLKSRGSDPAVHALMAEALRNAGNMAASLNHFRRAVAGYGNRSEATGPEYGVLMALLAERNWAALSEELLRARRIGCDPALLSYYGVLCRANLDEEPSKVLAQVQEAVREHGAVPELLMALAKTYFRLGLTDLAIGWYQKVTVLDPEREEAWLGYIACAETDSDEETFLNSYREYLGRWGDNLAIRIEFAHLLAERGKWKEAADQAESVISQDPSALPLRLYALWRRKAGQYREAAILYRNMLRSKTDDRVLLSNLVYCLDKMGDTGNALRLMREANRVLKADATSLLIEGRLLSRSGDLNAALEVFRKVIDRFPKERLGWEETALIYDKQGVREMAEVFRQKARDCKPRKN